MEKGLLALERASSRSLLDGSCWRFTGHHNADGYGRVNVAGRLWLLHRLAYTVHTAEIPPGWEVDHVCRVRDCWNPQHLEAVTRRENMRRSGYGAARLHAAKTHCPHGHALSGDNLYVYGGKRGCRRCRRAHSSAHRARQRAEA